MASASEELVDPRTVANLVTPKYQTCDETASWLTRFHQGQSNRVTIKFGAKATEIGLIRIWNYNKNRIHSSRGAREVAIWLDTKLIFMGEIERASGDLENAPE